MRFSDFTQKIRPPTSLIFSQYNLLNFYKKISLKKRLTSYSESKFVSFSLIVMRDYTFKNSSVRIIHFVYYQYVLAQTSQSVPLISAC